MKKNFPTLIYFIACIMIIGIFSKSLGILLKNAEPPVEIMEGEINLLVDESGELKYAHGSCYTDSDCLPTGCSMELCSSEELVSTCELKPDVPDIALYRCGCTQSRCAWITN